MPYKDPEKRRAMNRIYYQRWMERNPGRAKELDRLYNDKRAKNPRYLLSRRVQSLTHYYLKVGKLIRPDTCEACGTACKPDAAHADYSKPLEVRWLCRSCHRRWDVAEPKTPKG